MTNLRIVFAGTPEFGLPCLDALAKSTHSLVAVYSQPDRPAGRGRKLQPSAIKKWAQMHQLPIYQPLNFKDIESEEALVELKPDVLIVIAYGLLLPKKILSIPRLGCINVHASLLPRWRGASPIQQALLQGDKHSGVSIMQMDVGMDTGDVLAEVSCPLEPQETAGTLHDKLAQMAVEPLMSSLNALVSGQAKARAQDSSLATYARKINKEDAAINWQQPAEEIDRLIRAFNPWPIAYTYAGEEVLRIHQAVIEPIASTASAGEVLALDKKGMLVATGELCLRIQRVQFPGGKVISIADWLNSGRSHLFVNMVLT